MFHHFSIISCSKPSGMGWPVGIYFFCECIFMIFDCLFLLFFLWIFFVHATDASSFHSYGSSASNYNLFHAAHTLLMVVYRRDCRRPFAPKDHWLVKDVKSSLLVAELERGRQSVQVEQIDACVFPVRTNNSSPFILQFFQLLLQKMPHVIPLEDRVLLFRKYISSEKNALGLTETASASPQSILITVHRFFLFPTRFLDNL
jgi:ubiquitin-protein ligase E3 B